MLRSTQPSSFRSICYRYCRHEVQVPAGEFFLSACGSMTLCANYREVGKSFSYLYVLVLPPCLRLDFLSLPVGLTRMGWNLFESNLSCMPPQFPVLLSRWRHPDRRREFIKPQVLMRSFAGFCISFFMVNYHVYFPPSLYRLNYSLSCPFLESTHTCSHRTLSSVLHWVQISTETLIVRQISYLQLVLPAERQVHTSNLF